MTYTLNHYTVHIMYHVSCKLEPGHSMNKMSNEVHILQLEIKNIIILNKITIQALNELNESVARNISLDSITMFSKFTPPFKNYNEM